MNLGKESIAKKCMFGLLMLPLNNIVTNVSARWSAKPKVTSLQGSVKAKQVLVPYKGSGMGLSWLRLLLEDAHTKCKAPNFPAAFFSAPSLWLQGSPCLPAYNSVHNYDVAQMKWDLNYFIKGKKYGYTLEII